MAEHHPKHPGSLWMCGVGWGQAWKVGRAFHGIREGHLQAQTFFQWEGGCNGLVSWECLTFLSSYPCPPALNVLQVKRSGGWSDQGWVKRSSPGNLLPSELPDPLHHPWGEQSLDQVAAVKTLCVHSSAELRL